MSSIVYLLQVSACTVVFYLFYYLVLSRLTFFTANRWYLIITIGLSFIIPVLRMPLNPQEKYIPVIQQAVYINTLQYSSPVVLQAVKSTIAVPHSINWFSIVKGTYALAVVGLICHLLITLLLFARRLKSSVGVKLEDAIILKSKKTLNNGSFLNFIFLNDDELSADEKQQVIDHELMHVKLYHSIDRILVKLAQIILWFNPFIYFYAKAIEVNHEFEVDRKMASSTGKNSYAKLLLQLAVSRSGMLSNNFSKAPLKKRITMLFNKPSVNMKKAIYLLIVPVVLISCLAFSKLKSINVVKNSFSRQQRDTMKDYRQKTKLSKNELTERKKFEAYKLTDDFKIKQKAIKNIWHKEITITIADIIKDKKTGKQTGFNFTYDNYNYQLRSMYGQEKQLNELLKPGDKITMRMFTGGFNIEQPVMVSPAYILKDNVKIFQLAEADKLPDYPFLYETNKVRFANGQVSNIVKYPDGKWKTALFETVNGYKFNLTFKPNAPDLNSIEWGDHITLRFVHEVKTGTKAYKINDWVSLSKNSKEYGVKNPDLFNKFYTAI